MNSNTYKLTLTGLNEKAAVFAVTNSMGRCVGSVTAEAKEWRRVAECWGGEVDISRAEPAQAQAPAGETRLSHPLVHAAFDKLRRRGQRQRRPEREGITLRFRGISVTAELPAKIWHRAAGLRARETSPKSETPLRGREGIALIRGSPEGAPPISRKGQKPDLVFRLPAGVPPP
jgi:hypothetical protein